MSFTGEQRINLTALKRIDSSITEILDHASQVAIYKFNHKGNEWEKTQIEGTLFVYKRPQAPQHGFIVINRLNTQNLIEPITSGLEFQLQTPFLLYKNSTGQINGIWFYDSTECSKVEAVLNRLSGNALYQKRQRSVSESDEKHQNRNIVNNNNSTMNNGDILALLHQAQEEYDKLQSSKNKNREPKALLVQPLLSNNHDLIKPTPVRAFNGLSPNEGPHKEALKSPVSLSLASLFAQATQHQNSSIVSTGSTKSASSARDVPLSRLPEPLTTREPFKLQQLFSNPENTLEHIEKQQLNEQQKEDDACEETDTLPLLGAKIRTRATSCSSQMGLFSVGQQSSKQTVTNLDRQMSLDPTTKSHPITIPPSTSSLGMTLMTPDMFEMKMPVAETSPSVSPNFGIGSLDSLSQSLLSPLVFSKHSPPSILNGKNNFAAQSSQHVGGSRGSKMPNFLGNDGDCLQDSVQGSFSNSRISSSNAIALTKEQLRESLLYLLQNDDSFLNKIHEGYLASLQLHLART